MQSIPDERPSLTRMLSCRHSRKVSCETLSLSDNNAQFEAQSVYFSDADEKDHTKDDSIAGDAELQNPNCNYRNLADAYLQHVRELEKCGGKLDNPGYGHGKAAEGKFFSRFLSKMLHIPVASSAKEAERLRKQPRTICRTGGILPPSDPILLHIGTRSGGAPKSKAPATLRASSIIPGNAIAADKMDTPAGEPSSPQVTCFGRVRNKQKLCGKCISVAPKDTKKYQVSHFCIWRETKKADADVSKNGKNTSRMQGSSDSMVGDHLVSQRKKSYREKAVEKLTAQSTMSASSRLAAKEEGKKIWSLKEFTMHEESKFLHQHWQIEASAASEADSSSEFPVDLSRFGSESQSCHGHRQASLANPSLQASIWQRRAVEKPCPLKIKPITV